MNGRLPDEFYLNGMESRLTEIPSTVQDARDRYDAEMASVAASGNNENLEQLQSHMDEGLPDYTNMIDEWLSREMVEINVAQAFGITRRI